MKQRNWEGLSETYRKRLLHSGITKKDYLAGVNLQAARGQKIEARRTVERRKKGLPSMSTVRKRKSQVMTPQQWAEFSGALKKGNLQYGGMTKAKWNAGVKKHGLVKALQVAALRKKSHDHLDNYLLPFVDEKEDWPDSWFFYH